MRTMMPQDPGSHTEEELLMVLVQRRLAARQAEREERLVESSKQQRKANVHQDPEQWGWYFEWLREETMVRKSGQCRKEGAGS